MRVTLDVIAGPHRGLQFTFPDHDTFLVGRSRQAHLRLPDDDEYFSRHHFLIEVNPPRCRLLDLGSTNGTFVNGQKVAAADLRDGDQIEGGQTLLRVRIETDVPLANATIGLAAPADPELSTAPAAPSPPAERLDVVFPGYRVLGELGRGGMGVVYLAESRRTGEQVAIKALLPAVEPGPEDVERFLREARVLQQLSHPHIVSCRQMGEAGGRLFFVMDRITGVDAARLVKDGGPLPVARVVALADQLLAALQHAHDRGFVHRDVKPANLMVAAGDVMKVLDFGLARTYQLSRLSGLSADGQFGGTLGFMAPEQITRFRESLPAVDQYGAAATLYHLLTGSYLHDFPPRFQRQIRLVLEVDPVPIRTRLPDLSADLAAVLHRALSRDPAGRYPDVAAFRAALRQATAEAGKPPS